MTEQEFHKRRRMFAVTEDGTIVIAPRELVLSHREWLQQTFGVNVATAMIATCPRGYVLDGRLVAYVGEDFSHRVNQMLIQEVIRVLNEVTPVWSVGLGVKPSTTQPWEPKIVYDAFDYIM